MSRYVRDGIVFHSQPAFAPFIGTVQIAPANVKPVHPFSSGKPSAIEKSFYSQVQFFTAVDDAAIESSPHYIRCSNELYFKCSSTMNAAADYQLSSNSTYKKNAMCISSTNAQADAEIVFLGFLSSLKRGKEIQSFALREDSTMQKISLTAIMVSLGLYCDVCFILFI